MKIAYFDCFSGISGDMILGALVDAGLNIGHLRTELTQLPLRGAIVRARPVTRCGLHGTKVDVLMDKKGAPSFTPQEMRRVIRRSGLDVDVKERSLTMIENLQRAEARVHGTRHQDAVFHHVGHPDTLVDIVGSVLGMKLLGIEKIISSPINVGTPPPAVLELLRGVPIYSSGVPYELTTPTGAVLIATLAGEFSPLPEMEVSSVGYGAGERKTPSSPNLLRVLVGQKARLYTEDRIVMMEAALDDMNPQIYGHLLERLYEAGALEAYLTPIIMKKGRPGVTLTVLTQKDVAETLLTLLFTETTTLGIRLQEVGRKKLNREMREIMTRFGRVKVKVAYLDGTMLHAKPEYEDCKKIARKTGLPLRKVLEEVTVETAAAMKEKT